MKKIVLLFFITISLIEFNFAQQKEAGLNIGYGKSAFIYLVAPNYYYQIGVNYFYYPKETPFNLKAELNYDFRGNKNINFNYIKLPLGFDYIKGKKLKFI